jgi:hypothetical protein
MSRHWTMQMSLIFLMMTGISFISALHWKSSWCRIQSMKRCCRHRCGGLIMSLICTGPILDLSQSPLRNRGRAAIFDLCDGCSFRVSKTH